MLFRVPLRLLHAHGQQQQLEDLPPGHVVLPLEGAVGIAAHHARLVQGGDIGVGPMLRVQVSEGGRLGGQGGGAGAGGQHEGQKQNCDAFFHGVSFPHGAEFYGVSILHNSTPSDKPRGKFNNFEKFAKHPLTAARRCGIVYLTNKVVK